MSGISQEYIRNGSFEGFIPQENNVPQFWQVCRSHSTPDIQPVTSSKPASDGSAYIGLARRGANPADSTLAYRGEAIGQKIEPLTPGFEYLISIQLSYDPSHQSSEGETEAPGRLNVYIGDGMCFDTFRIWQSPIIDHLDWKVYERNYVASCFNNYIILEADHGDILTKDASYLLLDNLSIVPINNESALDTVDCGTREMEAPDSIPETNYTPCRIFIPNAISPNNDGVNEGLKIYYDCQLQNFDFSIFDRWGARIFKTRDPGFLWVPDGRSSGPYVYHLKIGYTDEEGESRVEILSDIIHVIP
ncbi:MAG: gliding motility-associated C-terminal domain-containing protein [Saprospiraceae bacterium]|nr:gliding motility-associated C-terminal domain-containing protein [Saprospiraceae bacterium]